MRAGCSSSVWLYSCAAGNHLSAWRHRTSQPDAFLLACCSQPLANGLTLLTLEVEASRDKVPIRNGYRHVGQRARIRVNGGVEHELTSARFET